MDTLALRRESANITEIFCASEFAPEPEVLCAFDGDYRLRVYAGPKGLKRLAAEWDALVSRMSGAHFWHARGWFESYLKTLAPCPDEVLFCAIYAANDELIAILPLQM